MQAEENAQGNPAGVDDLLSFFEPFIPVRRPGWEWVDFAA
jgi:hypothetical protein